MRKQGILGITLGVAVVTLVVRAMPASGAEGKKAGMVRLELELPERRFEGTPKNIRTPNLEPLKKDRAEPVHYVPEGTRNLAAGKAVTGSDTEPVIGELAQVTDGDKEGVEGSYVELGPGQQYIQIDLEQEASIHAVVVWHYHCQARVYRDVVVQTASDPDFILDVRTVYNNDHDNSSGLGVGREYEYIETFSGRVLLLKGATARYVRLYSNGSTADEMNHYTEVEVYGQPAE